MTARTRSSFVLLALFLAAGFLIIGTDALLAPLRLSGESSVQYPEYSGVTAGYTLGELTAVTDHDAVTAYVELLDESGAQVGWVLDLKGNGFAGALRLVASYDLSGSVIAGQMLENSETPGIGTRSEDPGYFDMFIGLGSEQPLPRVAREVDSSFAQVVSGATITFNGVARSLYAGAEYVKSLGGTR